MFIKRGIVSLFDLVDDVNMGVCDIKTVKNLYDPKEQRHFKRKSSSDNENDFSDICCKETDGCKEKDYDKKCINPDKPDEYIYKTFLNPQSMNEFVSSIINTSSSSDRTVIR